MILPLPKLRACRWIIGVAALSLVDATPALAAKAEIKVLPTYRRSISGVSTLNRSAYFAISDQGTGFDERVRDPERMRYMLDELGTTFGRLLGPVNRVVKWTDAVREDPMRPGRIDVKYLSESLRDEQRSPSRLFRRLVGGRLNLAAHGAPNAYPDYMGSYATPESAKGDHPVRIPEDHDAAAELSVAVMRHAYSDFDRPTYYEPINEPHWSLIPDQQLANWHTATCEAMRRAGVDVRVGGPCLSVAYFYKREFGAFDGLSAFMQNTRGELDFYSFHVYDYLNWDGSALTGRITSGLPIEGVLDMVQAHFVNEYGRETPIVISEQGGYINASNGAPDSAEFGDKLIGPGSGFDHTMRKRSIDYHVFVSSAIANAMAFMDHPHVVEKAVPFTLLNSIGWDPKYTAVMYTPRDFQRDGEWVETGAADYYRFFRGVEGQRVVTRGTDPDLPTRAFVKGKRLWVAINNLSDVNHTTRLKLPEPNKITLRRYRRNTDFTASYTEEEVDSLESIDIDGREAVMVVAEYDREIPERAVVEETPHYSNEIRQQPTKKRPARFRINVPRTDEIAYATLRVSVSRPGDASPDVTVKLNGKRLEVPAEDTAPRLATEQEYATTKLIAVPRSLVKERNRIDVSFPDGKGGTIGSAVLRVGVTQD